MQDQNKFKANKVKKGSEKKDYTILRDEKSKMKFAVSIEKNKYESLLVEELEHEPEDEIEKSEKLWEVLKKSLHHARDEVIPKKEKKNSKPKMTIDILNLMENVRCVKGRTPSINIKK